MQSVYHKSIYLNLLAPMALLMLSGCNGGGGGTENGDQGMASTQAASTASDPLAKSHIMDAIYYNKRVPESFYRESLPDPSVFQTIRHIRNSDLASPATTVYEVCTDSYDEALAWSEEAKHSLGDLVDVLEQDLFFQFNRVNPDQPNISNLQRVYKCEILDRRLVDINNPDEHMGFYYQDPKQAGLAKKIIEYLWTFSFLNNYGNAVLMTALQETPDDFIYTLYQARLTAGIDSICDTINLYETIYTVNKTSGNIQYTEQLTDTFKSKFETIPLECH